MVDSYREAVMTSSPTLPLGGYVGYRCMEDGATPMGLRPIGVEADEISITQGSRGGNPGLVGATASRYMSI